MRISDWSSDVCSSDLNRNIGARTNQNAELQTAHLGPVPQGHDVPLDARKMSYLLVGAHAVEFFLLHAWHLPCWPGRRSSVRPPFRSEARRVGKECVSPCSSRWSPYH